MWHLGNSWRLKSTSEALKIADGARRFAGISRVARIDGLTGIDIPIFSVTRPLSKTAITINSGKGTSVEESRLSGLFEAIEIAAAEIELESQFFSVSELEAGRRTHFSFSALAADPVEARIPWVETIDYETKETVLVPSPAVSMLPSEGVYLPTSNGLASGLSFEEAFFHGLLEVIERHAFSLALVHRRGFSVEMSTLTDPWVNSVREKLAVQDLRMETKDLTEWTGIPCYYSLIYSSHEEDSHLVGGGIGCHLDPLIAFRRALSEAVQGRAAAVAGAREDLFESERRRGKDFQMSRELFAFWYDPTSETKEVKALPKRPDSLADAIQQTIETARRHDPQLGRVVYRQLPAPENIFVVRTLWENAELFGLQRNRLGPRLRPLFH